MKRAISYVFALSSIAIIAFVGCDGGTASTIDDYVQLASDELAEGDFTGACDIYYSIVTTVNPTNAEARFGNALCNMIMLIEREPFTAMLAGFGQSAWTWESIFDHSTGFLAESWVNDAPASPDFSDMPFYNIRDCFSGNVGGQTDQHNTHWRCALSKTTDGYTVQTMASSFEDLSDYIDDIIEDLLVAITDSTVTFTLPKGFYTGDADMPFNHADMVNILATMYKLKALANFSNSWTFNIDLSALVDSNGNKLLTAAQFVELLNDQFGLRSDNQLGEAKINLLLWAQYAKQSMDEVLAGSTGGVMNLSDVNEAIYTDIDDAMGAIQTSFTQSTALAGILPAVNVDLLGFFNDPADGADIETDPFVVENGKIKGVEAFWQTMINTACDYDIGTQYDLFSAATRAVSRPYYQLFNVIMGHRFGRYYAGSGA